MARGLHFAAFACGIAVLQASSDAPACSTPCIPGEGLPHSGATIPANVPAVGFFGGFKADATLLELRTAQGDLVPALLAEQSKKKLLLLQSPLVAGQQYSLFFTDSCANASTENVFTASAAAPLPTQIGSLSIASEKLESIIVPADECATEITAATVTLTLTIAPEVVPFLPHIELETTVDGQAWNTSHPGVLVGLTGELIPSGSTVPAVDSTYRALNRIHTACQNSFDDGVAPGKHSVSIRARIAGSEHVIAPASIDIELACPPADGGVAGGAGASGAGARAGTAGASAVGGAGGFGVDAGDPSTAETRDSGGCSAARGDGRNWPGAMALLLLAALRFRARKSSRPPRRIAGPETPFRSDT